MKCNQKFKNFINKPIAINKFSLLYLLFFMKTFKGVKSK